MSEEKKYKNLSTYVVCMILAVIILIIFAAMADNREEQFEHRLNEKEQVNVSIQNQIVSLSDENYHLKKNAEETAKEEKGFSNLFWRRAKKAKEETDKLLDKISQEEV